MTGSADCLMLPRAIGRLQLGSWALGTSDRGGQDKGRKVRAVGRDGGYLKIPAIQQTLRDIERTLRCSGTRYRRSTFVTP